MPLGTSAALGTCPWTNVYDLVAPRDSAKTFSLDRILAAKKMLPTDMVRYGERFFTSIGFAPLPATFLGAVAVREAARSRGRLSCDARGTSITPTICASRCASIRPPRISRPSITSSVTTSTRARVQGPSRSCSATVRTTGFHEAIGDTIALSVTPEYLVKIGLLDKAPDAAGDIPLLMREALEKLAFLPFGLVVDQWRWQVFSGQVKPDQYNAAWWALRQLVPGGRAGVSARRRVLRRRREVPQCRRIRPTPATSSAACSSFSSIVTREDRRMHGARFIAAPIYGNAAAGERLRKTLAMGASRPWPDALEAMTGQRQMDASAMADYFAPLQAWLDKENSGRTAGW
jgi:peptidyl-dipeptidase A